MKRFLTLCLAVLYGLSGCGRDNGENADLVFVNDSETGIISVSVELRDRDMGAQRADGCPLRRGESFGFEVGEYPATVVVYDTAYGGPMQRELESVTIRKAPPEGERWYVTAKDSGNGLTFTIDTSWPEGV